MKRLAAIACAWIFTAFAHDVTKPAEGVALDQRPGAKITPTLAFVDERNRPTTLSRALGGRPGIVVLGYATCQDLCPMTLAAASRALRDGGLVPGRDYAALFVSVDPRDDAAALAQAKARDLPAESQPAWTFLSNATSAHDLAREVGFRFRRDDDPDAIAHAAGLLVVTPDAVVSRYFTGVHFDPTDVRLALSEAAQGRVGSIVDRLVLLCYHFDPATGRYTLTVINFERAAIAVFLVAAAAFAWFRLRRAGAA
ncbi:MAG TPA: SCO family protein [Usitatibacter sp.]|nr:SCO family protein [Usitatibacter sp.]